MPRVSKSNSYTAQVPCCREILLTGFICYSATHLSIAYSLKCQDQIVAEYIVTPKSRQKLRVYYLLSFTPTRK